MSANLKTLLADSGQDEAVSVNQRALVEKILARYSGEFTVYRELLQNADDAQADTVELHFRTAAGMESTVATTPYAAEALPDLLTHKTSSILVRNNGFVFRDQDWNRLKKIAEGNPDETKIGAFGVGFYSLFSVCDEPVVSSGDSVMGFYWKGGGDQLYVKTAKLPSNGASAATSATSRPWTSFVMDLREAAPMPQPYDFARFLATCLGFTANIKTVALYFDGHLLARIVKTLAPSRPIALRSDLASTSPLKILRLRDIQEVPLQLRAEVSRYLLRYAPKPKAAFSNPLQDAASLTTSFATRMLAAFSSKPSSSATSKAATPAVTPKSENPFDVVFATLFLRTVTGNLKVSPGSHFSAEMERATKKALPSVTSYSIIWTGKDEFDAGKGSSDSADGKAGDAKLVTGEGSVRGVFAGLMSDLDTSGRVFIGFPTFQTTGCAASMAARFVSTVERESIDFQSRYVNDWNRELLWAGGVLARTVYEEEMQQIMVLYKPTQLEVKAKGAAEDRALHLIKFFSFRASTPSSVVGDVVEQCFFSSSRSTITLPSQLGPKPSFELRFPNPQLTPFLKSVAIIPDRIATEAPSFFSSLRARGLVKDISLDDVFKDLASHPLTIDEAAACFKWWLSLASNRSYSVSLLQRLKDSAMLSIPDGTDVRILSLAAFKTFLNPKVIPPDVPLPTHTLPFELSRSFNPNELRNILQLQELSLVDWVKELLSPARLKQTTSPETSLLLSPAFAEKVLGILARGWTSLPSVGQADISTLLRLQPFLPTRSGSRLPTESYFANVDLFPDLEIVTLPSAGPIKLSSPLEKVLTAFGVRRHVELQLVFTRLLGTAGSGWSHAEVAKYLASVSSTLTPNELERLRKTAWLVREGQSPGTDGKVERVRADQLYEPMDKLRALGLPILDWPSKTQRWRSNSDEGTTAKLLFQLGLKRYPVVEEVLTLASHPTDKALRALALQYFLDEHVAAGFSASYSVAKHDLPFVPAVQHGNSVLAKPSQVYTNPLASLVGFHVLEERMQAEAAKLKLQGDPAGPALVRALVANPPMTTNAARDVFGYLSTQVSRIGPAEFALLREARIVPGLSVKGKVELSQPSRLFFQTDSQLPAGLRALFATVPDFGPAARPFLVAVGVKEAPSPVEIAGLVVESPERFYDLSGSSDQYLQIIRLIASRYSDLPTALRTSMKTCKFFLGTKRAAGRGTRAGGEDDDDDSSASLVYQLAAANELIINDDFQSLRVFEEKVLQCPQDDAVESLALALGSQKISSLVKQFPRTSGHEQSGTKRSVEVKKIVMERTTLFLTEHQRNHGRSELKHPVGWLADHVDVVEVQSIELVRTLSLLDGLHRHTQPISACVKPSPNGNLVLYIAGDVAIEWYEVAEALCRHTLVKTKPNDALLFMTILSTSLAVLQRRGFNVDRILNARKAEREAADRALREERKQAAERTEKAASLQQELGELFPDADKGYLAQLIRDTPSLAQAAEKLLTTPNYPRRPSLAGNQPPVLPPINGSPRSKQSPQLPSSRSPSIPASESMSPTSSSGGGLGGLRKLLSGGRTERDRSGSASGSGGLRDLLPSAGTAGPVVQDSATPSSVQSIRSNLSKAINASQAETSNTLSSKTPSLSADRVKEAESNYCDVSTSSHNLRFLTEIGGLRFFVNQDVPDQQGFLQSNVHALSRFVTQVIQPVGRVFGLPPRSLHVFHDLTGPLIAFNRGGSLYLNFRYYQAWHDAQVVAGRLDEALVSMYTTLAHEIAHNLVREHGAQHEFYTSELIAQYFVPMAALLQQSSNDPRVR